MYIYVPWTIKYKLDRLTPQRYLIVGVVYIIIHNMNCIMDNKVYVILSLLNGQARSVHATLCGEGIRVALAILAQQLRRAGGRAHSEVS